MQPGLPESLRKNKSLWLFHAQVSRCGVKLQTNPGAKAGSRTEEGQWHQCHLQGLWHPRSSDRAWWGGGGACSQPEPGAVLCSTDFAPNPSKIHLSSEPLLFLSAQNEPTAQAVGRGCSTPAHLSDTKMTKTLPLGQPTLPAGSRGCCPPRALEQGPVVGMSQHREGLRALGHKQPQLTGLRCHTKL